MRYAKNQGAAEKMIDLILTKLNFADLGILTGAVLLVILILYFRDKNTKQWMQFVLKLRNPKNAKLDKKDIPRKKAD